jgi:hypothetical protein
MANRTDDNRITLSSTAFVRVRSERANTLKRREVVAPTTLKPTARPAASAAASGRHRAWLRDIVRRKK